MAVLERMVDLHQQAAFRRFCFDGFVGPLSTEHHNFYKRNSLPVVGVTIYRLYRTDT